MFTCHDHARETLQEGEEDDDRAVGVDVARTIPETCLNKCHCLDEQPDGGHGLDAEEQGRGKVVDSSDALGKNRLGREKIARFSPSCD